MMELKINPEYRKIMPFLTSEEKKRLRESIKKDGIQKPLIVDDDKDETILDGMTRFEIAKKLGIDENKIPRIIRKYPTDIDKKLWVAIFNFNRRQMEARKRALVNRTIQKLLMEKNKKQRDKTTGKFLPS